MKHIERGFTIVELLIVIVVIGVLAALVLNTFSGVQARARDTKRIDDLKKLQKAVLSYSAENGSYPIGSQGSGNWSGHCPSYGNSDTYIQNLVPTYFSELPRDPIYDVGAQCYLYRSNGTDYMIITHMSAESICGGDPGNACNSPAIRALDRPAFVQPTFAVYSSGAASW